MKIKANSGSQITPKVIEWLHQCWVITESKRPLQPDPFYARNEVLTPKVVEEVIKALEGIFIYELKNSPSYHRKAQGISNTEYLIPPGFDKLPYQEQLAVVQGVDRIFQEYRDEPAKPTPQPEVNY